MRPNQDAGAIGRASIPVWISRFAAVDPPSGLYYIARCLGFRHFGRLERCLPPRGRVLDLGSGYGLFPILAGARGPERQVLGIDRLARRVEIGRRVIDRAGGPANVRLEVGDFNRLPEGPFDAITATDVLLYSTLADQQKLIRACRERLAPGGILLIKEQVTRPSWKARLVIMQERLVVGSKVRLRSDGEWSSIGGSGFHLWAVEDLERVLAGCGLRVSSSRLDRWSYLSHHLFIGVEGSAPPPPPEERRAAEMGAERRTAPLFR
jgi:SAM-dependent methyltransferase